ncbi:MAG: 23S rRNA (adenine(2503)-C(2))-methyltransferase RlmN [Patescibacteria group bacterium]
MQNDLYKYLENLTPLRQKQLRHAVFVNLIDNAEGLTTFSKIEREKIKEEFVFTPFEVLEEQTSRDGSTKWAFKLADGKVIETVLMEFHDGRNTVCVSSQVGCPSGCLFCATGQLGFIRNLSSWEILSQALYAGRKLKAQDKKITNIVFMGMGEPLLNWDNVLPAIKELNDPDYFNLGRRHMTLSTCGPIAGLEKFIEAETGVTLAISLHAPNQILREKLMPIARSNKLPDLVNILDKYVRSTHKRVSYEYLLLDGVNDTDQSAIELANLLKGKLAFVNLIVFNPIEKSAFSPSKRDRVDRFREILERNHIEVTVRVSLGDEISAACGQLAGEKS